LKEKTMRRGRFFIYLFVFCLITINYGDRVALSVGSKQIAEEFHLTSVQLGFLLSSFSWTYVLFLVPWGTAADRFGPRLIMMIGIGAWSAATMFTGLTWSLASLFGARMALGASESSAYPASGRLIRTWIPASQYGFANMLMISGGYAGPAVGAVVFGWASLHFGWRAGFLILGAAGFFWILAALLWFRRRADAQIENATGAGEADHREVGSLKGFGPLLSSPSLWGLFFTQGANVYSHYLYVSWLPNYLQTTRHLDVMKTGLFTSLPFAASVFGSIGIALLSDYILKRTGYKTGARRWMVAAMMIVSAAIVFLPFTDNIWLILTIFTLAITGTSAATGLNSALLTDLLASPNDAGKANGIFILGGNIFGMMAPIITGYVVEYTGAFDDTWYFCGAFLLFGAILVTNFTKRPIGKPHDSKPALDVVSSVQVRRESHG